MDNSITPAIEINTYQPLQELPMNNSEDENIGELSNRRVRVLSINKKEGLVLGTIFICFSYIIPLIILALGIFLSISNGSGLTKSELEVANIGNGIMTGATIILGTNFCMGALLVMSFTCFKNS